MKDENKTKRQLINELTELRQRVSEYKQFSKYLATVHRTSRKLHYLHSPKSLAQEIISVLEALLNYEFSAVLLIEETTKQLTPFALSDQGLGQDFVEADKSYVASQNVRVGVGVTGWVAQHGKSVLIGDVRQDKRYHSIREDIRSELCVPLIRKDQIIGVMNIETARLNAYSEIDKQILETIASQLAIAIENANLFTNLEQTHLELSLAYESTLKGWAQALELRNVETKGHSDRVTEMTVRLAKLMGVDEPELVHLRRGAMMHDIGKMAIPDSILLKPESLTIEEWDIMRKHPVYAYEMLSLIEYLQPALDIPYCHHEKYDGTGYPRGLIGEQIPLTARIFAIVDVWDALISDRPYRKAWSKEEACKYIQKNSGNHFDPQVVDSFMNMLDKF